MEDTWMKEAYADKARWEMCHGMQSTHMTHTLNRCEDELMPYHYAQQVWHVSHNQYGKVLLPILH